MRNIAVAVVLTLLSVLLVSCSRSRSIGAAPLPNIAGGWEFKAISTTNTNTYTGIEANLQEGQTLINGVQQANGQVSADGAAQISIISVDLVNATVVFGGTCPQASGGSYNLSGSIQSFAGPFNFSYTENGNVFNVTGNIGADGRSFTGTYSSGSTNNCPDSGTIVGTAVPKLTGIFVGNLILPDRISYSVTATLAQNASSVVTVNIQSTSSSTVNFSLSGAATGSAFLVQGLYQGQQVSYAGYFGVQVTSNGQPVSGIYFVNTTNLSQPSYAGTLVPSI